MRSNAFPFTELIGLEVFAVAAAAATSAVPVAVFCAVTLVARRIRDIRESGSILRDKEHRRAVVYGAKLQCAKARGKKGDGDLYHFIRGWRNRLSRAVGITIAATIIGYDGRSS